MVRRQKLISMTDNHFEVAGNMPNFSKWVREQIEKYIQSQVGEYGSYCKPCDVTASSKSEVRMMEYKCKKCGSLGEYLGQLI